MHSRATVLSNIHTDGNETMIFIFEWHQKLQDKKIMLNPLSINFEVSSPIANKISHFLFTER